LTGDFARQGAHLGLFSGFAIATIGIDLQSGRPRFTMDIPELQQGVSFLVAVVGLFALAEVSRMVEETLRGQMKIVRIEGPQSGSPQRNGAAPWPAILRGTGVGFLCGARARVRGHHLGHAGVLSPKKRVSRHPEQFRQGRHRRRRRSGGSRETRITCGAFVHLLALGIPASGSTRGDHGSIRHLRNPARPDAVSRPTPTWSGGLIASMYVGKT